MTRKEYFDLRKDLTAAEVLEEEAVLNFVSTEGKCPYEIYKDLVHTEIDIALYFAEEKRKEQLTSGG